MAWQVLRGQAWGELRITWQAGAEGPPCRNEGAHEIKIISRRIEARKVSIKMVDGSLVQGKVNLLVMKRWSSG